MEAIRQGIRTPDNEYAQYGAGFYTFRDREDADKWQEIRALITGVPAVTLVFEITDEEWSDLGRVVVPSSDNFRIYGERASEYDYADILEGPWSETDEPMENMMTGSWQYKFQPRAYPLLDRTLRRAEHG